MFRILSIKTKLLPDFALTKAINPNIFKATPSNNAPAIIRSLVNPILLKKGKNKSLIIKYSENILITIPTIIINLSKTIMEGRLPKKMRIAMSDRSKIHGKIINRILANAIEKNETGKVT